MSYIYCTYNKLILVTQANYLNFISVLSFETWVGLFIAYLVATLAAFVISHLEVESGFTKAEKWRRTKGMPLYILGTFFPQNAPKKIMFGYHSIAALSIFWATFGLLIIQIFNSNLRARLMAVGRN